MLLALRRAQPIEPLCQQGASGENHVTACKRLTFSTHSGGGHPQLQVQHSASAQPHEESWVKGRCRIDELRGGIRLHQADNQAEARQAAENPHQRSGDPEGIDTLSKSAKTKAADNHVARDRRYQCLSEE